MNKRLVGKIGEMIATKYLVDRGFKIICRNWTCHWGEIDLVAEKENILIFVEVKYRIRANNVHPSESINYYKRKSLQRSINLYLAKNSVSKSWRVDALCISRTEKSLKIDYYEYISLL